MHKRDNNFDILRLFAAILVIISHCFGGLNLGQNQPMLNINGVIIIPSIIGLSIFFVISGYLVMQSLNTASSSFNYLKKRVLRIYPGLIVCHLLCIILLGWFFSDIPIINYLQLQDTWNYLFRNLLFYKRQLYLPGVFYKLTTEKDINASIWTIQVEIGLYILLLIFWKIKLFKIKSIFTLFFALFVIASYFFHDKTFRNWPIDNFFIYSLYFFTGVLIFLFKDQLLWKWYLPFLMGLSFLILKDLWITELIIILAGSYLIIYVARLKQFIRLKNVDVSYGLYIYAYPVQQCLLTVLGYQINPWLFSLINFTVVLPIAFASWKLIEQPFLKLK